MRLRRKGTSTCVQILKYICTRKEKHHRRRIRRNVPFRCSRWWKQPCEGRQRVTLAHERRNQQTPCTRNSEKAGEKELQQLYDGNRRRIRRTAPKGHGRRRHFKDRDSTTSCIPWGDDREHRKSEEEQRMSGEEL